MASIQVGLQLYTVRGLGAEDFPEMLRKVAAAGYTAVEFAGYGTAPVTETRVLLDELGVKTIGAHVPIARFETEIYTVIDELNILGGEFAVVPWLAPDDRPTSRDQALALAEKLNGFAEKCKAGGLRFGYHNHDFELAVVDGEKTVLDLIAETTDPELVTLELDIYWAQYAGGDAVDLINRYAGRLPLLHAKDLAAPDSPRDAVVGEGVIDWPQVIETARNVGTEWLIVEQDRPNEADPIGDVARSLRNLTTLLA